MPTTDTTPMLEIHDEHGASVRHALDGQRIVLGRSTEADIKLATGTVSRKHAELLRDPFGRWWLRDLASHNGTYVNGERIDEAVLNDGDVATIGEFTLRLMPESPAASDAAPGSAAGEVTIASVPTRDDTHAISALRQVEPAHVASEHLSTLARFGEELIATPDAEQRLAALCALVVSEPFPGTAAAVLRLARDVDPADAHVLSPMQQREGVAGAPPHVSRTLLRAVLRTGEAMMATNASVPGGANGGDGAVELSIGADVMPMAAIACPLRQDSAANAADPVAAAGASGAERSAGALDVLYTTLPPTYATGEWLALVALAARQHQQAELAWAGRRQGEALAVIERELEQARQLQMRLLPRQAPIAGLDTAIAFEPCRWVGGDYADILELSDGRVLLTVADVCGKGMQAALTTASVHAMVHAGVRAGASLNELMSHLNAHLVETLPDSSFVTMSCLALDLTTGELECVSAGHPPPLLVDARGELRHLEQPGNLPLGVMDSELDVGRAALAPGQWIALYSDGLTELVDDQGVMLGLDGLGEQFRKACAAACAGGGACDVADALLGEAKRLRGQALADDDWTLLVVRRMP